jgi:beta propeller repeat protein
LNPAIYGNLVVWQDSRAASDNQDVYGYDLNTHTEFPVCTAGGSQVGPAIYGDIVVWMDYRNEPHADTCWPDCNTDIYGYDLSTASEFAICTEGHFQGYPAIYGDTVVWIDARNGNWDVYAYNLTTHQEVAICTEVHEQIAVSISEGWIVWADMRNEPDPDNCGTHCNVDLYAYSRSTGLELPLLTEPYRQLGGIDGNLLLWADLRNEVDPVNCWPDCNYDIYGAALVSGEAGFAGGRTQNIGLDEDLVVEFTLPMDPSSVTYACSPDPGGWTETWGTGALLAADNTVLECLRPGHRAIRCPVRNLCRAGLSADGDQSPLKSAATRLSHWLQPLF